jgi:TolB-like protein/Tfp pilus assembly protein PilF
MKVLIAALAVGFPLAVVLAWAFEITPGGIVRAEAVPPNESITPKTGRKLTAVIVVVALIAAGLLAFQFLRPKSATMSAAASAATSPGMTDKSIAVLPFENLSSDKENAYFTDGVQDEILTDLAKIADLKVISRTSVLQYKSGTARNLREIGQQLGVAHLLEGTVQRAGGKVRVNAQLIDARTDAHLWAQVYDRPLDDVFAIQSEIAKAIADQLQAKLSPSEKTAIERPPTSDVAAFDLYSRAKTLLLTMSFSAQAKQNLLQAADLLNQAVARDPQFFLAYCQLASTHANLYFLGLDHTAERRALADTAIQTAFRLRPDAGEAHIARAEIVYRIDLDYSSALAELETARRTLPNDPRIFELTGYIRRRQGQHEEGLHKLQRALELDPRNFLTLQQVALSYQMMRRYAEEVGPLDRALAINPNDTETKVARALLDLDGKADPRPLHQTIESIRADSPGAIGSVADNWLNCALAERDARQTENALVALGDNIFGNEAVIFNHDFCEGLVAQMTNDQAKARSAFSAARIRQEKVVQAQPDYGPAVGVLGLIDAGLGRKEDALQEGRRAVELLPIAKDSINGANMIEYFAMIAAWVGEKELACEQLAAATRLPGTVSYGQLKLFPYWDTLRGDPRFEKIVADLAPKSAAK